MTNGKNTIAVVGAGSWGTALAQVFADVGAQTTIWGRDSSVVKGIQSHHRNPKYLKDISLSPSLQASDDLESVVKGAEIVICSIPTQQIRLVFSSLSKLLSGKLIVKTSKGIEVETHATVSEIFREIAPGARYAILSGPSFAEEVAKRLPTAVTVAAQIGADAEKIQKMLVTPYFRVYRSKDVAGVELAGALKNVVAIASGVVSGLNLGYNAQAAIINRGIAEIMRMGKRRGADPMTFLGLAGMGDLILTCTGPLSRNRRLGTLLAQGKSFEGARQELGGVAEGAYTARSAAELARQLGVDMPITDQVNKILYQGGTPQKALTELMSRDLKDEWG
jgi:glycerol-3-phosphate dehydrogenase (NAD(P)+)